MKHIIYKEKVIFVDPFLQYNHKNDECRIRIARKISMLQVGVFCDDN